MNCKVAQHLCYAVECRIIVYIRCSKKCWPNPCSDVGVLCLNELLDADGTDKVRWTIIEDKARKLVSSRVGCRRSQKRYLLRSLQQLELGMHPL